MIIQYFFKLIFSLSFMNRF